jgi:hypothetical protein
MKRMTDELKETIVREEPNGIWLVLTEENLPDVVAASDTHAECWISERLPKELA